jgi:Mrp family chromosome partitioning ATPase
MSVLRREVSLEAAVKAVSGVKDLWLLDAGPLPSDPHRMLSDPATARVLKELALNFDMVLIDSPPLLAVADAIQLGQIADATVLVTSLGQTKKRQLQRALEMLETSHVPVIGLLLNAVTRQSTYGYGYSGYTGYSSKAPALTTATPEGELSTGVPLAFLSGDGDTHGSGAHSPNRVATPDVGEARPAWRALADQADSPG